MNQETDGKARNRIIFLLKMAGPQTADELAGPLGITSIAVRQHLQSLQSEGLLTHTAKRGKVGRPAHVWQLTDKADDRFPDGHADLTHGLLAAVRAIFGDEGLGRVVEAWTQAQVRDCRPRLGDPTTPLEARIDRLVALRRDQGYMAEWTREDDGAFTVVENHCPICTAATACESLCDGETDLFARLLGPGVSIDREEHIVSGDRRCLFRITVASDEG